MTAAITATTETATPARLRFGQVVRYEGSITRLRGAWYRVSGTYKGHDLYDLTPYFGRESGEPLRHARRQSLVPVKVERYTCRADHYTERGEQKYPCPVVRLAAQAAEGES